MERKDGKKEKRIKLEDRPVEREEKEEIEYWCALVGRRSIPLMKYILRFVRVMGEGWKREKKWVETQFREGTVRKVVASRRNKRKRAQESEEKRETRG